jgi:hypothetical protein
MTIKQDIANIPRKVKNGAGGIKTTASVHVDPVKLGVMRAMAKSYNVSISGIVELALDRLLTDIEREAA